MKFSRRATQEDFDKEVGKYTLHLSYQVREWVRNGEIKKAKSQIVYEIGVSYPDAKEMINEYLNFYLALKDFHDGKDVYVEY